jgi:hypothetical protein
LASLDSERRYVQIGNETYALKNLAIQNGELTIVTEPRANKDYKAGALMWTDYDRKDPAFQAQLAEVEGALRGVNLPEGKAIDWSKVNNIRVNANGSISLSDADNNTLVFLDPERKYVQIGRTNPEFNAQLAKFQEAFQGLSKVINWDSVMNMRVDGDGSISLFNEAGKAIAARDSSGRIFIDIKVQARPEQLLRQIEAIKAIPGIGKDVKYSLDDLLRSGVRNITEFNLIKTAEGKYTFQAVGTQQLELKFSPFGPPQIGSGGNAMARVVVTPDGNGGIFRTVTPEDIEGLTPEERDKLASYRHKERNVLGFDIKERWTYNTQINSYPDVGTVVDGSVVKRELVLVLDKKTELATIALSPDGKEVRGFDIKWEELSGLSADKMGKLAGAVEEIAGAKGLGALYQMYAGEGPRLLLVTEGVPAKALRKAVTAYKVGTALQIDPFCITDITFGRDGSLVSIQVRDIEGNIVLIGSKPTNLKAFMPAEDNRPESRIIEYQGLTLGKGSFPWQSVCIREPGLVIGTPSGESILGREEPYRLPLDYQGQKYLAVYFRKGVEAVKAQEGPEIAISPEYLTLAEDEVTAGTAVIPQKDSTLPKDRAARVLVEMLETVILERYSTRPELWVDLHGAPGNPVNVTREFERNAPQLFMDRGTEIVEAVGIMEWTIEDGLKFRIELIGKWTDLRGIEHTEAIGSLIPDREGKWSFVQPAPEWAKDMLTCIFSEGRMVAYVTRAGEFVPRGEMSKEERACWDRALRRDTIGYKVLSVAVPLGLVDWYAEKSLNWSSGATIGVGAGGLVVGGFLYYSGGGVVGSAVKAGWRGVGRLAGIYGLWGGANLAYDEAVSIYTGQGPLSAGEAVASFFTGVRNGFLFEGALGKAGQLLRRTEWGKTLLATPQETGKVTGRFNPKVWTRTAARGLMESSPLGLPSETALEALNANLGVTARNFAAFTVINPAFGYLGSVWHWASTGERVPPANLPGAEGRSHFARVLFLAATGPQTGVWFGRTIGIFQMPGQALGQTGVSGFLRAWSTRPGFYNLFKVAADRLAGKSFVGIEKALASRAASKGVLEMFKGGEWGSLVRIGASYVDSVAFFSAYTSLNDFAFRSLGIPEGIAQPLGFLMFMFVPAYRPGMVSQDWTRISQAFDRIRDARTYQELNQAMESAGLEDGLQRTLMERFVEGKGFAEAVQEARFSAYTESNIRASLVGDVGTARRLNEDIGKQLTEFESDVTKPGEATQVKFLESITRLTSRVFTFDLGEGGNRLFYSSVQRIINNLKNIKVGNLEFGEARGVFRSGAYLSSALIDLASRGRPSIDPALGKAVTNIMARAIKREMEIKGISSPEIHRDIGFAADVLGGLVRSKLLDSSEAGRIAQPWGENISKFITKGLNQIARLEGDIGKPGVDSGKLVSQIKVISENLTSAVDGFARLSKNGLVEGVRAEELARMDLGSVKRVGKLISQGKIEAGDGAELLGRAGERLLRLKDAGLVEDAVFGEMKDSLLRAIKVVVRGEGVTGEGLGLVQKVFNDLVDRGLIDLEAGDMKKLAGLFVMADKKLGSEIAKNMKEYQVKAGEDFARLMNEYERTASKFGVRNQEVARMFAEGSKQFAIRAVEFLNSGGITGEQLTRIARSLNDVQEGFLKLYREGMIDKAVAMDIAKELVKADSHLAFRMAEALNKGELSFEQLVSCGMNIGRLQRGLAEMIKEGLVDVKSDDVIKAAAEFIRADRLFGEKISEFLGKPDLTVEQLLKAGASISEVINGFVELVRSGIKIAAPVEAQESAYSLLAASKMFIDSFGSQIETMFDRNRLKEGVSTLSQMVNSLSRLASSEWVTQDVTGEVIRKLASGLSKAIHRLGLVSGVELGKAVTDSPTELVRNLGVQIEALFRMEGAELLLGDRVTIIIAVRNCINELAKAGASGGVVKEAEAKVGELAKELRENCIEEANKILREGKLDQALIFYRDAILLVPEGRSAVESVTEVMDKAVGAFRENGIRGSPVGFLIRLLDRLSPESRATLETLRKALRKFGLTRVENIDKLIERADQKPELLILESKLEQANSELQTAQEELVRQKKGTIQFKLAQARVKKAEASVRLIQTKLDMFETKTPIRRLLLRYGLFNAERQFKRMSRIIPDLELRQEVSGLYQLIIELARKLENATLGRARVIYEFLQSKRMSLKDITDLGITGRDLLTLSVAEIEAKIGRLIPLKIMQQQLMRSAQEASLRGDSRKAATLMLEAYVLRERVRQGVDTSASRREIKRVRDEVLGRKSILDILGLGATRPEIVSEGVKLGKGYSEWLKERSSYDSEAGEYRITKGGVNDLSPREYLRYLREREREGIDIPERSQLDKKVKSGEQLTPEEALVYVIEKFESLTGWEVKDGQKRIIAEFLRENSIVYEAGGGKTEAAELFMAILGLTMKPEECHIVGLVDTPQAADKYLSQRIGEGSFAKSREEVFRKMGVELVNGSDYFRRNDLDGLAEVILRGKDGRPTIVVLDYTSFGHQHNILTHPRLVEALRKINIMVIDEAHVPVAGQQAYILASGEGTPVGNDRIDHMKRIWEEVGKMKRVHSYEELVACDNNDEVAVWLGKGRHDYEMTHKGVSKLIKGGFAKSEGEIGSCLRAMRDRTYEGWSNFFKVTDDGRLLPTNDVGGVAWNTRISDANYKIVLALEINGGEVVRGSKGGWRSGQVDFDRVTTSRTIMQTSLLEIFNRPNTFMVGMTATAAGREALIRASIGTEVVEITPTAIKWSEFEGKIFTSNQRGELFRRMGRSLEEGNILVGVRDPELLKDIVRQLEQDGYKVTKIDPEFASEANPDAINQLAAGAKEGEGRAFVGNEQVFTGVDWQGKLDLFAIGVENIPHTLLTQLVYRTGRIGAPNGGRWETNRFMFVDEKVLDANLKEMAGRKYEIEELRKDWKGERTLELLLERYLKDEKLTLTEKIELNSHILEARETSRAIEFALNDNLRGRLYIEFLKEMISDPLIWRRDRAIIERRLDEIMNGSPDESVTPGRRRIMTGEKIAREAFDRNSEFALKVFENLREMMWSRRARLLLDNRIKEIKNRKDFDKVREDGVKVFAKARTVEEIAEVTKYLGKHIISREEYKGGIPREEVTRVAERVLESVREFNPRAVRQLTAQVLSIAERLVGAQIEGSSVLVGVPIYTAFILANISDDNEGLKSAVGNILVSMESGNWNELSDDVRVGQLIEIATVNDVSLYTLFTAVNPVLTYAGIDQQIFDHLYGLLANFGNIVNESATLQAQLNRPVATILSEREDSYKLFEKLQAVGTVPELSNVVSEINNWAVDVGIVAPDEKFISTGVENNLAKTIRTGSKEKLDKARKEIVNKAKERFGEICRNISPLARIRAFEDFTRTIRQLAELRYDFTHMGESPQQIAERVFAYANALITLGGLNQQEWRQVIDTANQTIKTIRIGRKVPETERAAEVRVPKVRRVGKGFQETIVKFDGTKVRYVYGLSQISKEDFAGLKEAIKQNRITPEIFGRIVSFAGGWESFGDKLKSSRAETLRISVVVAGKVKYLTIEKQVTATLYSTFRPITQRALPPELPSQGSMPSVREGLQYSEKGEVLIRTRPVSEIEGNPAAFALTLARSEKGLPSPKELERIIDIILRYYKIHGIRAPTEYQIEIRKNLKRPAFIEGNTIILDIDLFRVSPNDLLPFLTFALGHEGMHPIVGTEKEVVQTDIQRFAKWSPRNQASVLRALKMLGTDEAYINALIVAGEIQQVKERKSPKTKIVAWSNSDVISTDKFNTIRTENAIYCKVLITYDGLAEIGMMHARSFEVVSSEGRGLEDKLKHKDGVLAVAVVPILSVKDKRDAVANQFSINEIKKYVQSNMKNSNLLIIERPEGTINDIIATKEGITILVRRKWSLKGTKLFLKWDEIKRIFEEKEKGYVCVSVSELTSIVKTTSEPSGFWSRVKGFKYGVPAIKAWVDRRAVLTIADEIERALDKGELARARELYNQALQRVARSPIPPKEFVLRLVPIRIQILDQEYKLLIRKAGGGVEEPERIILQEQLDITKKALGEVMEGIEKGKPFNPAAVRRGDIYVTPTGKLLLFEEIGPEGKPDFRVIGVPSGKPYVISPEEAIRGYRQAEFNPALLKPLEIPSIEVVPRLPQLVSPAGEVSFRGIEAIKAELVEAVGAALVEASMAGRSPFRVTEVGTLKSARPESIGTLKSARPIVETFLSKGTIPENEIEREALIRAVTEVKIGTIGGEAINFSQMVLREVPGKEEIEKVLLERRGLTLEQLLQELFRNRPGYMREVVYFYLGVLIPQGAILSRFEREFLSQSVVSRTLQLLHELAPEVGFNLAAERWAQKVESLREEYGRVLLRQLALPGKMEELEKAVQGITPDRRIVANVVGAIKENRVEELTLPEKEVALRAVMGARIWNHGSTIWQVLEQVFRVGHGQVLPSRIEGKDIKLTYMPQEEYERLEEEIAKERKEEVFIKSRAMLRVGETGKGKWQVEVILNGGYNTLTGIFYRALHELIYAMILNVQGRVPVEAEVNREIAGLINYYLTAGGIFERLDRGVQYILSPEMLELIMEVPEKGMTREIVPLLVKAMPALVAGASQISTYEPIVGYKIVPKVVDFEGTKVFVFDLPSLFKVRAEFGEITVEPRSPGAFKVMENIVRFAEKEGKLGKIKFAFVSNIRGLSREVMEQMLRDYMRDSGLPAEVIGQLIDKRLVLDRLTLRQTGKWINTRDVYDIVIKALTGKEAREVTGVEMTVLTDNEKRWRERMKEILWVILSPPKKGEMLSTATGLVVAIEGQLSPWLKAFIKENWSKKEAEKLLKIMETEHTFTVPATPVPRKYLERMEMEKKIYRVQA